MILTKVSVGGRRTAFLPATASRSPRLVLVAVLLALGIVVVDPAPTPAEAAGCLSSQIAVVVSFNSLGGGTQTSCVGDVGSGLAALSEGGFSYTFVERQPGFVCTISGAPNPCNGAPANAYWSYWLASMGGGWSYSSVGAGNRNPASGSVEGWSFGAGSPPAISPPAAVAPPPPSPPPPPPPPPPVPTTTANPGGGGGGNDSPGSTTGRTDPDSSEDSDNSDEGGTSSEDPSDPDSSASDSDDASTSGSDEAADGSSSSGDGVGDDQNAADQEVQTAADSAPTESWPVFVTIAILAVFGGGAYWQNRRRNAVPPEIGS